VLKQPLKKLTKTPGEKGQQWQLALSFFQQMRFEADRDLQADVISNSKFVGSPQFFVEIDGYLQS